MAILTLIRVPVPSSLLAAGGVSPAQRAVLKGQL